MIDFKIYEISASTDESMNIGIEMDGIVAKINKIEFDEDEGSSLIVDYKLYEGIPDNIDEFEKKLSKVLISTIEESFSRHIDEESSDSTS